MGQKISDGKAFDAVFPDATEAFDGDLYRIGGWNGCIVGAVDLTQTDRTRAFECSEFIHSIKVPAALNPAVGDKLYWTAGAGFKRGDTDLAAAVVGDPCFKVLGAKNPNGYVQGRVLNQ